MDLTQLGWDEKFAHEFDSLEGDARVVPARVSRVDKSACRVLSEAGDAEATVLSRDTHSRDQIRMPAIGDWCAFRPPEHSGPGVIDHILTRRTVFSRRAAGRATREQHVAANINVAFLVTGLDENYSLRRIERLLALTWESGAHPVVILNKADACDEVEERVAEATAASPGAEVMATSASTGEGMDELRGRITTGTTVVFLGSSGVGKSTIINRLYGHEHMKTAAVRADDGRGRHTTTHRELIVLSDGGVLIDSPGVREVGMWVGEEAIDTTFADITALAPDCRFTDCTHEHEPGCAVRAAVERGEIPTARCESYHRLRHEAASAARRSSEHLQRDYERRTMGRWRKQVKDLKRKR